MSLTSTLSLFLFSVTFTSFVLIVSSVQTLSTNVSLSCTEYQTPCALGCCPFAEGVCCADGFECCQHGQTCIPVVGLCIGLVKNSKEALGLALNSTKATPVKNLITNCPPGTTECGEGACCNLPNAVCCSDGEHCCPEGYTCDLPYCVKNSNIRTKYSSAASAKFVPATKSIKKSPYKSCPGTNKICPSYSSCCIFDNGEWGCCPNISLKNFKMGDGECCNTIFGYMCCPDDYPRCWPFGCTNA